MKRSKIPSLDDLRAFEAVSRLGSVRAAANDLALTHSAISRRVSKLAHDIDVPLLEPAGRGIKLTSGGEKLGHVMRDFFQTLTKTLEEIQSAPSTPTILLSCERSLAMHWLIPHLGQFQEKEADISINLSVGGGAFDFKREGITLALRRMDFNVNPSWKVDKLFEEEMGPVLTEDLSENFKSGNYIALSSKTRPDAWQDWLRDNPQNPPPREYMQLDHHFLMVEAALSGLGVAICPKVLVLNEIKKGRLNSPHGFQKDGSYYGLIYQEKELLNSEASKIHKWILALGNKMHNEK
jgi:DNA-binding transcriptional LysR family regulator